MFEPCPKRPNCVSSLEIGHPCYVDPIRFSGPADSAFDRLLSVLTGIHNAKMVKTSDGYVRCEFRSALFRFVDDVEFLVDREQKLIHAKSASRVGFYDLGVNRRRLERIRNCFNLQIPYQHTPSKVDPD